MFLMAFCAADLSVRSIQKKEVNMKRDYKGISINTSKNRYSLWIRSIHLKIER